MTLPGAVENPRWLAPCGCEMPIDGPAYPVCLAHSVRARIVTGDNLTHYVGTPAERLGRAEADYAQKYEGWVQARDILLGIVQRLAADLAADPYDVPLPGQLRVAWASAAAVADDLGRHASEVARVERDAAAAGVAVAAAEEE